MLNLRSFQCIACAELLLAAYCTFINENNFAHFLFTACLYIEERAKDMVENTRLLTLAQF